MKLEFKKNDLNTAISIVMKAVAVKSPMTVLECILIDATDGKITMTGNDMEFGIETVCDGVILEPGKIALEAKLLSEIVRKLPEDRDTDVSLQSDDYNNAVISCENSVFKIMGIDGNEFSMLPQLDKSHPIAISQITLKNIISKTIFSISANDVNKKMTGEYFEVDGGRLTVTSLDGHRISIRYAELNGNYQAQKAIVPGKSLSELSKILSGDMDDVLLYFSQNHMIFEFNNTIVLTRLIDGDYFQVSKMLSDDYELKILADRRKLLENIERSTIFVRDNDKQPLILNITDEVLEMRINTEIGRMDAKIPIRKTGKDLMIGFNPRFLVDALKNIDDEEVSIYMSIPRSPCFIRNENNYNYMILPVNFNPNSV